MRGSDPFFDELRKDMIREQLAGRGISDRRVLDIMGRLPRHHFVLQASETEAYEDHPLPIVAGQTISQPYMVALMTERLALTGTEKVLEIGTGSGYQTAILAGLCRRVWSVERLKEVHLFAKKNLKGYPNVSLVLGDGTAGLPEHAPFDRILVTAGAPPVIPAPYIDQLAEGGLCVVPAGDRAFQTLKILTKINGKIQTKDDVDCVFVPLIGEHGW
jgi:protein-L-isoaspartate(D-aspartate) O-methyltransferase